MTRSPPTGPSASAISTFTYSVTAPPCNASSTSTGASRTSTRRVLGETRHVLGGDAIARRRVLVPVHVRERLVALEVGIQPEREALGGEVGATDVFPLAGERPQVLERRRLIHVVDPRIRVVDVSPVAAGMA